MTRVDPSISPIQESSSAKASLKNWFGVVTISVAVFLLVTAEQLPIGLLTYISSGLDITKGMTGLLVTVPGVVAAIAALLLPAMVGRLDRRILLLALVTLVAVSNLFSAIAPNYTILLVSRVFLGLSIGGFFAIVGKLTSRLVPKKSVHKAISIIFGGVGAAAVLGIPIGTLMGELSGWRTSFALFGGISFMLLPVMLFLLPPLPTAEPVKLRELVLQLYNIHVQAGIIAAFLIVTGHFAAYTFVSPILQMISGIEEHLLSTLLLTYGFAGIIGNFIAGSAAGRDVRQAILTICITLTVTMVLFPVLGKNQPVGIALLILWGMAFGGVSVSLQIWMQKAAPQAVEAVSALWVSTFNLSISLGALIGGLVVDMVTISNTLWFGGMLVALAAMAMWRMRKF